MSEPVFFPPSRHIDAIGVAQLTGAALADPTQGSAVIRTIAPAGDCGPGSLVFVDGKRAGELRLDTLRAAAVLCSEEIVAQIPAGIAVLVTKHPQQAFAMVARLLFPDATIPGPITGETGISPAAHIAADARIEPGAIVEAGAVIGPGVSVGSGTVIAPNAVIGRACQIGRNGYVGPGVTVQAALIGDRVVLHAGVRIGTDGFGYVPGRAGMEKIPQIGRVVIQDDVEIGANTTIDRGAMGDTIIGEGTKIDNLVQIGHNVRIGRGCALAAQCGISGSVTIGDFALLGGRAAVGDHIAVGSGAQLAGNSGVIGDVPAGARWGGFPAQPAKSWLREVAVLRALAKGNRKKKDGDA